MKILFLIKLEDYWLDKYHQLNTEFPNVQFINNTDTEKRIDLLSDADGVVSGKLTEDEINSAANLKILFIPYTGLNNFPVKLLHEKNIIIARTHANAKYVAEKALALSLALLGKVILYHNDLQKGYWHRLFDETEQWTSLQNKTCGILGYGHIGKNISKLLKGFDCNIIGYKKHLVNNKNEYANEITSDINYVIEKSDILFTCLPLTSETKGLINKSRLQLMKGKYLINVGRGEVIEEKSLYEALNNNILAGAGLDVWYKYPRGEKEPFFPSNYPIHELPNVVISPHKASQTYESIISMIDDTFDNIRSFIQTGKPKIFVDDKKIY
jgi:phosphoglycerate dehydrogenase-like enzyme